MTDERRGDLEPVGDVLDQVLGRFAGPGPGTRVMLFDQWQAIAGPKWAETRPISVDPRGVLVVEVASGATASRLRFEEAGLLGRIKAAVGEDVVNGIRFRVARNRA